MHRAHSEEVSEPALAAVLQLVQPEPVSASLQAEVLVEQVLVQQVSGQQLPEDSAATSQVQHLESAQFTDSVATVVHWEASATSSEVSVVSTGCTAVHLEALLAPTAHSADCMAAPSEDTVA